MGGMLNVSAKRAGSEINIILLGWAMGVIKCNARCQGYKLDKEHKEIQLTILGFLFKTQPCLKRYSISLSISLMPNPPILTTHYSLGLEQCVNEQAVLPCRPWLDVETRVGTVP